MTTEQITELVKAFRDLGAKKITVTEEGKVTAEFEDKDTFDPLKVAPYVPYPSPYIPYVPQRPHPDPYPPISLYAAPITVTPWTWTKEPNTVTTTEIIFPESSD